MDKREMAFKALNNASEQKIYEYSKNIPLLQLEKLLNKLTVLRKRLKKVKIHGKHLKKWEIQRVYLLYIMKTKFLPLLRN